ncbi:unnamed protein product, partial [Bubo scandiacus]
TRSTRADPPRGRGQAETTGETANRDAGSAGGDPAAQWAPRRAWPSGGSAGATRLLGRGPPGPVAPLRSSERSPARRVPANVVDEDEDEDEERLAFRALSPRAPTPFLAVPKEPVVRLSEAEDSGESLLGRLTTVGKKRAARLGLTSGFRMAADEGPQGGQSACRVHLRVLGGRRLGWPPGLRFLRRESCCTRTNRR